MLRKGMSGRTAMGSRKRISESKEPGDDGSTGCFSDRGAGWKGMK